MNQTPSDPNELPPIVGGPNADETVHVSNNPFAPSVHASTEAVLPGVAQANLDWSYWLGLSLGLLFLFAIVFLEPFVAILGMVALVFGAMRVPLVQRRVTSMYPERRLPLPFLMLLTSSVFMVVAGIASFVCFGVICVPTSLLTMSVTSMNSSWLYMSFGLSGLVAVAFFFLLFYLSLRLPV